jgi:hypothetical protein
MDAKSVVKQTWRPELLKASVLHRDSIHPVEIITHFTVMSEELRIMNTLKF